MSIFDEYIKPFHDNTGQEYSYFSIEKITENLKIKKSVYKKALAIVSSGAAVIRHIRFGFPSREYSDNMFGYCVVTVENEVSVTINFGKETMVNLQCQKYGCGNRFSYGMAAGTLCVHETAALILLSQYLAENRPGDSTDRNAEQLLRYFRSEGDTEHLNPVVKLIPKIQDDAEELRIRLLITKEGIGRDYLVKNITELFETYSMHERYFLGKNNKIDFSSECFTDESKQLAVLVNGWLNEKKRNVMTRYISHGYDYEMKKYITLYGDRADRFFDMYEGKRVMYEPKKTLLFKNGIPKISLEINRLDSQEGKFEGVTVSGQLPAVFEGNQYRYCRIDDCFCRIDKDYEQKAAPLLAMGTGSCGEVKFTVGRKNLSEFYYTVLPVLRQTVQITEKDDEQILEYLPPEVFFRFYLDIDNGIPECRVETRYGETGVAVFDLLYSDELKEDFRDSRREWQVLELVLQYFPEFQREQERFIAEDDADMLYEIVEKAVPEFMRLGDVVCTDRFQNVRIRKKIGLSIGVSIESELLDLKIEAADISPDELLDIIKSYRRKKKYHRLKNGEFVNIDDSIAELSAMLETMQISPKEFVKGKMQIPAYRALYLDKMLEQSQEIYAKRDSHFKKLIKSFKTVSDSDFEVPEELQGVMRGYQRFGHKWLRTVESCGFGGILADDMGLGKTLQMISVLLAEKNEGVSGTSLIICPASLVFNWAAEFKKFAPSLDICTVTGTQKERIELISHWQEHDVLITSYDLLKRDSLFYEDCEFLYQVLDEAQYIKNHTTAASKAVKIIHAKHRFALTGTPIENRLSELWSIFDYLMPGLLYGYETFRKEFEIPVVKKSDENAAKRLRRMTSPFILRRLKQDVLRDLPEKLEEDYIVRMDEEQRRIYDATVLELRSMLEKAGEEEFQTGKLKLLAKLTQIRQVCCDPLLLFEDYKGESAKKNACLEIVQRAIEGEHRVLIFSQFTSMLYLLETELNRQGIPFYKITGETPKKKRLELVESFNSGDIPVFLISLKAGGTGLNLTGADVVVHYDPWWNVAAQNQATDRAHRIGQEKNVTVYKLIAQNTIEEKIQQMQVKKRDLADSVLNGEAVNLSSLSRDELMDILR
ncbi:MAG: DEAD/DEAH box helicase [Ruminococcus sp.]